MTNDTQPNKLYRNQRNGTFKDVAVEAGIAFSAEGKARAGMGVDVADFDNSGSSGVAITNFDNEMIGLYRSSDAGNYGEWRCKAEWGWHRKTSWDLDACFSTPIWMVRLIWRW